MKTNPTPYESQEQVALFQMLKLLENKYPDLQWAFHVPNGGYRNAREAANFSRQGVKSGVPDIILPLPTKTHHGLFIELKRQQGGKLSKNQKRWIEALNRFGYKAVVCKGAREALDVILEYMKEAE